MVVVDNGQLVESAIKSLDSKIDALIAERATADDARRKKIDDGLAAIEARLTGLETKKAEIERSYLPGVKIATSATNKDAFSWARALKLAASPSLRHIKEYGYEVECFAAMQKKFDGMEPEFRAAINAGTDQAGGFLIPHEAMDVILPLLEATSIADQLGITNLQGLVGTLSWPKDGGGIDVNYIDTEAEATGAETVNTFSNITMTPRVLAGFVPLTHSMITQPALSLESWVRTRLATRLALFMDNKIFLGTGADKQPLGILNTPGINTVTWSSVQFGAVATLQNITKFLRQNVLELGKDNALNGATKLGWAMSPNSRFALSETKDTQGNPIFTTVDQAATGSLLGYPLRDTQQLASGSTAAERLIFGDWAKVMHGHWGTMALASSSETETNFRQLRTTVRIVMAHDVAITHAEAFCNNAAFDVSSVVA